MKPRYQITPADRERMFREAEALAAVRRACELVMALPEHPGAYWQGDPDRPQECMPFVCYGDGGCEPAWSRELPDVVRALIPLLADTMKAGQDKADARYAMRRWLNATLKEVAR
jgi:hypothetical protein